MRGASVWAGVCAAIGLGMVFGVGFSVSEGSSAARAVEVGGVDIIGDDEADRFVGSGAVFLPSTVSAARRQQAAWCHGCRWKVTTPCLREDEHSDAGCRGSVLGCPQGREIGRAWLALPGGDFEPVGLFCPHDGEVTSVADMSTRIRGDIVEKVPPLSPQCLPARGAVVGIDLHCRSGQSSARLGWSSTVVGHAVVAEASATWSWAFEQRARAGVSTPPTTREWVHTVGFPGGVYPDRGIRQAFTTVGRHLVQVQSAWRGRYWVDGLGPFDVQDPVRQEHAWEVDVGSAVGVLMH